MSRPCSRISCELLAPQLPPRTRHQRLLHPSLASSISRGGLIHPARGPASGNPGHPVQPAEAACRAFCQPRIAGHATRSRVVVKIVISRHRSSEETGNENVELREKVHQNASRKDMLLENTEPPPQNTLSIILKPNSSISLTPIFCAFCGCVK